MTPGVEVVEPLFREVQPRCALVVPVFKNEGSITELLGAIEGICADLGEVIEAVFVIDGSPDRSEELLRQALPGCCFVSQLVVHTRNFGSFAAIRTGLAATGAQAISVMAADLQEPPELAVQFFRDLIAGGADVVVGRRVGRGDPLGSRLAAGGFWRFYRRFVQPEVPVGGVDVFGCTAQVRDAILSFDETNSALVGQLLWVGFRRVEVAYERRPRSDGAKSGWSFRAKWRYMINSVFAFTDLPIRMLTNVGVIGMLLTLLTAVIVLILRLSGTIDVRGYTPLMLAVLFVGALNLFALGIVGSYVWRAYENTKRRPLALSRTVDRFVPEARNGDVRSPVGVLRDRTGR
ncbi:MAG: glycosyltransferase [Acidimicrobiales bacterium]